MVDFHQLPQSRLERQRGTAAGSRPPPKQEEHFISRQERKQKASRISCNSYCSLLVSRVFVAKGRKKPKLLPSSFSDTETIHILCWGTAQFRDVNVIGFEQEEEAGSGGANGSRNLGTLYQLLRP